MNIINDILISSIIFIIIIFIRGTVSKHGKGGIIGGFLIVITGILVRPISILDGNIIIMGGFLIIAIALIEHGEHRKNELEED